MYERSTNETTAAESGLTIDELSCPLIAAPQVCSAPPMTMNGIIYLFRPS
jgi:hypothetical protein